MDFIKSFFGLMDSLTWGWALIPILVIFGVFITIMSGFVQFSFFGRMFRVLTGKDDLNDPNSISAREALLVSVGGRVGAKTSVARVVAVVKVGHSL